MKQLRSYEEYLFENLKDEKEACAYLNEALMDEDPRVFLLALTDVIQAQGLSMSELAKITGLKCENLYRVFKKSRANRSFIRRLVKSKTYNYYVYFKCRGNDIYHRIC